MRTVYDSFRRGMGSLLRLNPSLRRFEPRLADASADGRALRGDWDHVGRHIQSSLNAHTRRASDIQPGLFDGE